MNRAFIVFLEASEPTFAVSFSVDLESSSWQLMGNDTLMGGNGTDTAYQLAYQLVRYCQHQDFQD